jgi:vacuolar-type H+-ATPase subunit H
MSNNNEDSATTESGQAMNTVLQAERDAIQTIEQCKEQVTDIINQAQLRAQRIRQTTDKRIARVHNKCIREANDEVRKMMQAQAKMENLPQDNSREEEILTTAVERLAKRILGLLQDN